MVPVILPTYCFIYQAAGGHIRATGETNNASTTSLILLSWCLDTYNEEYIAQKQKINVSLKETTLLFSPTRSRTWGHYF